MTHSPEPWDYEGVYASSCGHPCTPDGCHDSHFSGFYALIGPDFIDDCGEEIVVYTRDEKQARTIAAAPDLLEACKGLVRYAEAVRYTAGMGDNQAKRLEAAKAAIAKAEGAGDE